MKTLLTVLLLLWVLPANAQVVGFGNHFTCDSGCTVQGTFTKPAVQSLTRPANTTAYSAGQAVCASTSSDCTGIAFAAGRTGAGTGRIIGVRLTKSTTTTTNASFTIAIYQAAPTLTGIHDGSAFTPKLADVTSGAYVTLATCNNWTVNGDNATTQCVLANPIGMAGYTSDVSGNIYAVIQANAAYSPGSGEQFLVSMTFDQD